MKFQHLVYTLLALAIFALLFIPLYPFSLWITVGITGGFVLLWWIFRSIEKIS